jgi:hypothetical protein
LGGEAVIYALIILSAGEVSNGREHPAMTPSTPSGMIPVYEKPAAPKRRKKPGAKLGHQGYYRQLPPITHHQEQPPLRCCPDCGTPFGQPSEQRTRVIEDIADVVAPVAPCSIPVTHPFITKHLSKLRYFAASLSTFFCPACEVQEQGVPGFLSVSLVLWVSDSAQPEVRTPINKTARNFLITHYPRKIFTKMILKTIPARPNCV